MIEDEAVEAIRERRAALYEQKDGAFLPSIVLTDIDALLSLYDQLRAEVEARDKLAESAVALTRELRQEVDALRGENERLGEIIEGKSDRETLLRWLNVRDGAVDLGISPPQYVMRVLAEMFAFAMDDAPDFQTAQLTMKAQDYEMTIRKVDGKTPAQLLCETRDEATRLSAEVGEVWEKAIAVVEQVRLKLWREYTDNQIVLLNMVMLELRTALIAARDAVQKKN